MKVFIFEVKTYDQGTQQRRIKAKTYNAALNLLYFSPGSQVASANLIGTAKS